MAKLSTSEVLISKALSTNILIMRNLLQFFSVEYTIQRKCKPNVLRVRKIKKNYIKQSLKI